MLPDSRGLYKRLTARENIRYFANAAAAGACDLYYWRDRNREVDFVLRSGPTVVAIEVKATRVLRPKDLRGLRAIAALPELRRRIVVFTGERRSITEDKIEVLPFDVFASLLALGRL